MRKLRGPYSIFLLCVSLGFALIFPFPNASHAEEPTADQQAPTIQAPTIQAPTATQTPSTDLVPLENKVPEIIPGEKEAILEQQLQAKKENLKKIQTISTDQGDCAARELGLKNCHLSLGSNKIHAWGQKIFLNDGRFRATETLVEHGDAVQWQSAKLTKLGGRLFVQMNIWTAPVGEGEIQSLRWVVYEIVSAKFQLAIDQVVQKRRKVIATNKVVNDNRLSAELKLKGSEVIWNAGRTSGILPKPDAGPTSVPATSDATKKQDSKHKGSENAQTHNH